MQAHTYESWQKLFNVEDIHVYSTLAEAMNVYEMRHTIWSELNLWNENVKTWKTGNFREVGISVASCLASAHLTCAQLDMEEVKAAVMLSYGKAFKMSHKIEDDRVVDLWKTSCEEFKINVPALMDLGNKALKERHWRKIFKAIGQQYSEGMVFTLADLISYEIFNYRALIQEISQAASGEWHLELTLQKIKAAWQQQRCETCVVSLWAAMLSAVCRQCSFNVVPYKKKGKIVRKVHILGSVADITALLEEHQLMLSTIAGMLAWPAHCCKAKWGSAKTCMQARDLWWASRRMWTRG